MTRRTRAVAALAAFGVACVYAVLWASHAAPVAAASRADSIPTVLHIDPVGPITAGDSFTVTGVFYRHVESGNAGIPNRGVKLYLEPMGTDGAAITKTALLANVFSNKDGHLRWVVHRRLESGHYRLYFLYPGSRMWRESFATTELTVKDAAPAETTGRRTPTSAVPTAIVASVAKVMFEPGEMLTMTARLADRASTPLAGHNLYFRVPGATQQRQTDARGVAVFVIRKPLAPGSHVAHVSYLGRAVFAPTDAWVTLNIAPPAPATLIITDDGAAEHYVGDDLAVVAQLSAKGQPLANHFVRFFIDGDQRTGARTGADGAAPLRIPRDLGAGTHIISVTFRGGGGVLAADASMQLKLLPKMAFIQTVPPLPNVGIRVDDRVIETDANGAAELTLDRRGSILVTVLPYESSEQAISIGVDRWSDGVFSATRKIRAGEGPTATYQIGLEISHPVQLRFIEEATAREVSTSRLSNVTLMNSAGEVVTITVTDGGAHWLKANRIVRLNDTLIASPVSYHLRNITVDGVNVVNEGQQRFHVSPNAEWTMKLQLHDLAISVQDALFGFPLGEGMRVAYPSGRYRDIALDTTGHMRLESLSRGSYTVTVQGVMGLQAPTPIALSRSQEVDIAIISYLDLGLVGGMLIIAGLGVLLIGRRRALAELRFRLRRAA